MNWQIELLTSPEIRLVIGAFLIALPVCAFAAAWAFRRLSRRAFGRPRRHVDRETEPPHQAAGAC